MIVAIESNFVLELAFRQGHAEHAERILDLGGQRQIQLVIPSCSLTEPFETLARRTTQRRRLNDALRDEIGQLARSEPFANLERASSELTNALATSGEHHKRELETTIRRIASCATVVPTTTAILNEALDAQGIYNFSPQDAFVFASIMSHIRTAAAGQKLFVNKDRHDFFNDQIREELERYGCELIPEFPAARGRIDADVARG